MTIYQEVARFFAHQQPTCPYRQQALRDLSNFFATQAYLLDNEVLRQTILKSLNGRGLTEEAQKGYLEAVQEHTSYLDHLFSPQARTTEEVIVL